MGESEVDGVPAEVAVEVGGKDGEGEAEGEKDGEDGCWARDHPWQAVSPNMAAIRKTSRIRWMIGFMG